MEKAPTSVETAFPTQESSEKSNLDSHSLAGLFRSVQWMVLQTHSASLQPIRRSDMRSIVACLANISDQLAVASADITFAAYVEANKDQTAA